MKRRSRAAQAELYRLTSLYPARGSWGEPMSDFVCPEGAVLIKKGLGGKPTHLWVGCQNPGRPLGRRCFSLMLDASA